MAQFVSSADLFKRGYDPDAPDPSPRSSVRHRFCGERFSPSCPVRPGTPKRGGVLTVHLGSEQRILNPALRASTGVYLITSKIMEALVDLDAKGNPTPVLATSWDAAPDGKTVTFKLREGVTWHDGKPFTSADVAIYGAGDVEEASQLRHAASAISGGRRYARRQHGGVPLFASDAAQPAVARALRPRLHRAPSHLRGHQYPGKPGQHRADRHGPVQVRLSTSAASSSSPSATRTTGARISRISTASSGASSPTSRPSLRRSKPARSSSVPITACRSPISTA